MAVSAPTFVQPLAGDHTNVAKIVVVDITFDSSYPTGGEAFDIQTLGLSEAWYVSVDQIAPDTTSLVVRWDYATAKFIAFWVDTTVDGAAMAEVVNTTDLSAVTVRAFFYGLSR